MKMQKLIYSLMLSLSLGALSTVEAKMNIGQATKHCEAAVAKHCQTMTCPKFCEKQFERRRTNKEKLIADCKADCQKPERCSIKPLGGNDDPKFAALDAQNREQGIACIAEMRDPEGITSGRRMQDWQEIQTPSWQKLMQ